MKVVIQRSGESYVDVDNKTVGKINFGFVVLVGFTHDDNIDDIKKKKKKIVNSVNGQGKFDELTKNDIDDVIKMFRELQEKIER